MNHAFSARGMFVESLHSVKSEIGRRPSQFVAQGSLQKMEIDPHLNSPRKLNEKTLSGLLTKKTSALLRRVAGEAITLPKQDISMSQARMTPVYRHCSSQGCLNQFYVSTREPRRKHCYTCLNVSLESKTSNISGRVVVRKPVQYLRICQKCYKVLDVSKVSESSLFCRGCFATPPGGMPLV